MEPTIGFEPMTVRLQGECSTSWAKLAKNVFARHILLINFSKSTFFSKKNDYTVKSILK